MKRLVLAAVAAASLLTATSAWAGATPEGTIHQFIDAFNKGDAAGAAATHAADVSIIDEVAPHIWSGPGGFQAWATTLMSDAKAKGQSENKVTLGDVIRSQDDGDTAYVVFKATYSYEEKGVDLTEPAQMVFSLRKTAGDWKISAWAWSGTVPTKK
jgi:ketosteroid isomerase-like protein